VNILIITIGDETVASSRTRVYQYLPYFENDKMTYKLMNYDGYGGNQRLNLKIRRVLKRIFIAAYIVFNMFRFNNIFIQKVLFNNLMLNLIKFNSFLFKTKIIFDFDDAIFEHSKISDELFSGIIQISDLVILENDFSKKKVESINDKANILLATGPIDTNRYIKKTNLNKDKIIIGWIGSPSTTQYLLLIKDVILKICKENSNVLFYSIGSNLLLNEDEKKYIKQFAWELNTEVEILQNFDIGIMPLDMNAWSEGKGGYKILQYMSMNIPSIVTPVGINKKLIQNGFNGYKVDNTKEWYEKLLVLINDEQLRYEMGNNARKAVLDKYSFEHYYKFLKKELL